MYQIRDMPCTKQAMLKVIHMTENVYNKFQCEELLELFKNYSARRDIIIQEEVKKKQEIYEKAQKALQSKSYLPTKTFSGNWKNQSSIGKSNGYGLVEDDDTMEYNPGVMSRANVQNNKKRPSYGSSFGAKSKKGKWANSSDSPSTSGYKKKTPFKKKSFKKFSFRKK